MPPPPRKPAEQPAKNERNEYIPSFISKSPSISTTLPPQKTITLSISVYRTPRTAIPWLHQNGTPVYRKGACENCGSMTHKTKECLYRTRKAGAKWTGKDIQADEVVQDVKLGWDAKRDRWNGYDANEYNEVVEEYNALEAMKKAAAAGNQNQLTADGEEEAEGDEGAKYEEETDMGRQQSTSTRNLRLREDTAKYLLNLDLESAKYDPKTRSMVDAGPGDSADASEGFERASGDAAEFERAQRHAWEAQERGGGNNVHLQANPTAGEITRKREQEEAAAKKEAQKKALLERYGGQEHVQRNPLKDTAVTENERMYAEDVLINNHTSVWGSWWRDFKWGYACCHSTVKNSFCTGEAGKQAFEEAEKFAKGTDLESSKNSVQVPKEIAWKTEGDEEEHVPNAVDRPEKARRDNVAESADRKRKLDEMKGSHRRGDGGVSQEKDHS
ncbi:mRNA splicing protein [Taxawa tesnikishii (nom. ined.)]|nr:mRNA splicing protein [Dothideales sp. JES 119]